MVDTQVGFVVFDPVHRGSQPHGVAEAVGEAFGT
jgi:hypothetical protein